MNPRGGSDERPWAPGADEADDPPPPPPHPQGLLTDGYALAQMVEDLRKYQAELEVQNEALRYSQQVAEGASERFITLFSSVPIALMVVNELGQVVESNAMALQLFRPRETDRPLTFLLPTVQDPDGDRVAQAMAQAKEQGSSVTTEVGFLHGADGTFVGDLHMARIEDGEDDLAQFICGVINQTPLLAQRRELEQRNEELHLSENRMAAVINASLDAIVCVDGDLRITVFNPAAATLFGCPSEQALGQPLQRFLPDLTEAALRAPAAQLGEMQARSASGGALAVEVSASRERQPRGDVITLFARDLTARNQAEAQRAALEAQLRQSQKMQAMGTMAGGIAHDFNNILSAILGNVELARQDSAAGSHAMASLTEIDKAGRRARDLVRQILTFSRNDPPRRAPVQLADVVHETTRLLKTSLRPGVTLELALAADIPPVLADATQVEQALLNLCTNGLQAMGSQRGSLRIALDAVTLEPAEAERLGLAAGRYARLAVRDSGEGMAADLLPRIFEPFFTTKQVGQGTGLGLSVVHGIMRAHQGAVHASSQPGQGSEFSLYFPAGAPGTAVTAPESRTAQPEPPATAAADNPHHVMYVDDDQALVFLVQRVLSRRGYRVTTFCDPHAAEAALREDPRAYDLLVTDYNMPGYSGVDLLRQAKAVRADLPVALASGYVTAEIETAALREGASALIHKPNDVSEFCAVVQRLLQDDTRRGQPDAP